MPDSVQLPVSLLPGQSARGAAPQVLSASDQGADAPFARSLTHLLRGAAGLALQQDPSAMGGTDLPPMDQILPPEGQLEPVPEWGNSGSGTESEGAGILAVGTGIQVLSGEMRPGDAVLLKGEQRQDRPLASQQVLQDSQRELSVKVSASTTADADPSKTGAKQETLPQTGQMTTESAQPARTEGQPAVEMQARRLETVERPVSPGHQQSDRSNIRTEGDATRPDSGVAIQTPSGIREGEPARSGEQAWSDRDRPGSHTETWQGRVVQSQRGESKQSEPATQPAAVATGSANDSVAQSQTVASISGMSRNVNADLVEGERRPAERIATGTGAPAWQSGRSSEPLELASSVAGDRLQRFAEQWSNQMNERGGQSAWQGTGAGNPTGTSGPAASAAPLSNESGGPANPPATQVPSSAVPPASTNAGTMPPLPSLTTMPGSSVEAAARNSLSPDAALTGSREAFGSSGTGPGSAREQWGEALSQRISLMTARNQSEARIQLDPPELGRLMIQIQVNSEQASVSFTSPHALVRDALEANVPRLQDMLSEQGLDLLDVDISDQSQQQADEHGDDERSLLAGAGEDEGNPDEAALPLMSGGSLSLVDDYV